MRPWIHPFLHLVTVFAATLAAPSGALAGRIDLKGPIEAEVLRVLDGDTVEARALIWPGQSVRVSVRIRGIDAPEIHSRCAREREAAGRARDMLAGLVAQGRIALTNIGGGKYYGRVLADVATPDEADVAALLLEAALVRPYRGGRRQPYCAGGR